MTITTLQMEIHYKIFQVPKKGLSDAKIMKRKKYSKTKQIRLKNLWKIYLKRNFPSSYDFFTSIPMDLMVINW